MSLTLLGVSNVFVGAVGSSYLLQEIGDKILQEDGFGLLLES
jgi:hypothetical protein